MTFSNPKETTTFSSSGKSVMDSIRVFMGEMGQFLSCVCGHVEKKDINVLLKRYNNQQRILLVGEGDFSFSASLAEAFGSSASRITATSIDSETYVHHHYRNAIYNIEKLTSRGAVVMHDMDATTMSKEYRSFLMYTKFDRIIYNFPFYQFKDDADPGVNTRNHIEKVQKFLWNAKRVLAEDGEIHITHRTTSVHLRWIMEECAWAEGLSLVGEVPFRLSEYPGLETKYGFRGDKNLLCDPCKTYMWRIASTPHHLQ